MPMKRMLPASIAGRYLFSKKRLGAVGIITTVSIVGVAVATAAILCVLSVFNGFREVLEDKNAILAPDVAVVPLRGKEIHNTDSLIDVIGKVAGVRYVQPVVADNALVLYQGREMPVRLKGVEPDLYRKATAIESIIAEDGRYMLSEGSSGDAGEDATPDYDASQMTEEEILMMEMSAEEASAPKYYSLLSVGVAMQTGARPTAGVENLPEGVDRKFSIFVPNREGQLNPANPAASFQMEDTEVSGVYQSKQNDSDKDFVIVDIDLARRLLQYDSDACSSIEIKGMPGTDPASLARKVAETLKGTGNIEVKDSMQLQEMNFKMISIEKWMSFLLLAFILVIASFNIISAMSMLVLDKENNLAILYALGARKSSIAAIFRWESAYVVIIGGAAGLILGTVLCLLQQHYGLITLGGDPSAMVVSSYPVKLVWSDIPAVALPLVLIGAATAWITGRFARSRI